jgi:hypothetical protein
MTDTAGLPFEPQRPADSEVNPVEAWVNSTAALSVVEQTTLGLPTATQAWRKLVDDGALWALTAQNEHGWTLVVTHVQVAAIDQIIPGRPPTLDELREARRIFVQDDRTIMAALLDSMTPAMLARITRSGDLTTGPSAPGVASTVRCVQVHVEGLTDDVVFGLPT